MTVDVAARARDVVVMKCVHCGQRKGKRDCPALKGTICSQCCGTHRLKAIACPADCTWLGSLPQLVTVRNKTNDPDLTVSGLARAAP